MRGGAKGPWDHVFFSKITAKVNGRVNFLECRQLNFGDVSHSEETLTFDLLLALILCEGALLLLCVR